MWREMIEQATLAASAAADAPHYILAAPTDEQTIGGTEAELRRGIAS